MSLNNQQSESSVQVQTASVRPATRISRHARAAWWFKLFAQPLLAVAAIVALVFAFGIAQKFGWFDSEEQAIVDTETSGEEVQYICPMVCVPPTTEPGKCPVCGMELKAKKLSGDSKDKYGLRLDQASIRVANIQTTVAKAEPLHRELQAIGQISYDEGSLATISAYVDGRIEKLFADYTGVKVNQGDELALLYSPDLYASQVALLESLNLSTSTTSNNERIVKSNRRLYESSRQRLIELGLTESQVTQLERIGKADSRIRIVSPITGTVIEKLADKGQYIKTGQPIYKVADLSTVWLMLELFPKDASKIAFGQKVITKIQSHPGQKFVGRIAFIDPTVDPGTQTVRVRVVIPNEKGLIRVGDFATAAIGFSTNSRDEKIAVYDPELANKWISPRHPHIISDGPGKCTECGMDLVPAAEFGFVSSPIASQKSVVIPRDAVLMAGDKSVVYVETEPGRFEFRSVEVDQIVGNSVSIISGVEAGESVASSAAFLIDSQFNMSGKPSLIDPTRAIPREPEPIDVYNSPEVVAALANLSEADRESVRRQKNCPVADQVLGSMGPPIPVNVKGRTVWICCEGCRQSLLDEPQKYFDVLDSEQVDEDPMATELPQITPLDDNDLPQMELPKIRPLDNPNK